jgi:hypothetical protein
LAQPASGPVSFSVEYSGLMANVESLAELAVDTRPRSRWQVTAVIGCSTLASLLLATFVPAGGGFALDRRQRRCRPRRTPRGTTGRKCGAPGVGLAFTAALAGAWLTARVVSPVGWQDPKEASMGKRLRCRLGMHTWTQKHTEDNRPYRACLHCGAEDIRGEGRRPGLPEVGGG